MLIFPSHPSQASIQHILSGLHPTSNPCGMEKPPLHLPNSQHPCVWIYYMSFWWSKSWAWDSADSISVSEKRRINRFWSSTWEQEGKCWGRKLECHGHICFPHESAIPCLRKPQGVLESFLRATPTLPLSEMWNSPVMRVFKGASI